MNSIQRDLKDNIKESFTNHIEMPSSADFSALAQDVSTSLKGAGRRSYSLIRRNPYLACAALTGAACLGYLAYHLIRSNREVAVKV